MCNSRTGALKKNPQRKINAELPANQLAQKPTTSTRFVALPVHASANERQIGINQHFSASRKNLINHRKKRKELLSVAGRPRPNSKRNGKGRNLGTAMILASADSELLIQPPDSRGAPERFRSGVSIDAVTLRKRDPHTESQNRLNWIPSGSISLILFQSLPSQTQKRFSASAIIGKSEIESDQASTISLSALRHRARSAETFCSA